MGRRNKIHISNCFNQPVFSERIIESNFYNELQKNGWCEVVNDKPDNLKIYIKILKSKRRLQ